MKQIQYKKVRERFRELIESLLSYDNVDICLLNENATIDGHRISLELRVADPKPEYEKGEEQ